MTVPTTTSSVQYTGTGLVSVFPYTWQIAQATDLIVYKRDTTGLGSLLTLTTDYTVSGVGVATGGNVTLIAGNLTSGWKVLIASDPAQIQQLLLTQGGQTDPASVMASLDLLTREVQANRRLAGNSLQFPVAESLDSLTATLPAAANRANKTLSFDASGNATVLSGVVVTSSVVPVETIDQIIDTVALLKALAKPATAVTYLVRGYYAAGDGGGGQFRWNSADTSTDNGGTVIAANAGGNGRWNRMYAGDVDVRWFGAKCDGSTDDTVAVQAALTLGGSTLIPSGYTSKCTSANLLLSASSALFIAPGATLWLSTTRLTAHNVNNVRIAGGGSIKSTSLNTTDALFTGVAGRGIVEFIGTTVTPANNFVCEDIEIFGDFVGTPGSISIAAGDKRRGIYLGNVQQVRVRNCNVHGVIAEAINYNNGVGIGTLDYAVEILDNQIHDCNHDAISPAAFGLVTFRTHGNTMWNCLNGIEAHLGEHENNFAYNMQGSGFGFGGNVPSTAVPVTYKNNVGYNNGIASAGACDFSMQGATTPGGILILDGNFSYGSAGAGFIVQFADTVICKNNTATAWGRLIAGAGLSIGNATAVFCDGNALFDEGASSSGGYSVGASSSCLFGVDNTTRNVAVPYANFASAGNKNMAPMLPVLSAVSTQSLTGSTSLTALVTRTVPAMFLGVSGGFKVTAQGTSSGAGGTKTVTIVFGGTTVATLTIASGTQQWRLEAIVGNVGVTTNQNYGSVGYVGAAVSTLDSGTSSVATLSAQAIILDGQLADSGDTLTCKTCLIEFFNGMLQ